MQKFERDQLWSLVFFVISWDSSGVFPPYMSCQSNSRYMKKPAQQKGLILIV